MKITLEGGDALKKALGDMGSDIRNAMSELVMDTAAGLEADVKLSIQQGAKTGRIYQRGGVVHQASAPGQAPASDNGDLIGSIYHERETDLTARAGSRLQKALWLEYGTTKMAPRPHWQPNVERTAPEFRAEAEAILGKVTK